MAVQTGVYLSRAQVLWFKHNDMQDLERVLTAASLNKSSTARKFIIFEGIYENHGTVAHLDRIVTFFFEICCALFECIHVQFD